ncbi:hypothetical protein GQ457_05G029970 [Hibiscus cannabinus]
MCGNGEGFIKFPHAKVPDTSGVPAFVDMSVGLKECEEKCLRNCSCMAYASANSDTNGGVGCLTWHGDLVDTRAYTNTGQDLYVRVDKTELARYTKKGLLQKKGVLAGFIVSSALVFLILVTFFRRWAQRQRRGVLMAERSRKGKNIIDFKTFEDTLGEKELDESTGNGDLPYFDLSTIAAATNNFSSDNKLGQGGFGPVYKCVLLNGKEIAVKRLSKNSGQGVQEFKNEIVLIAKLQHRNLVRMLGYCIEGEEKMLIYEFLPNKSLDHFRGYMSPEYAMHGHFSMKSDVYSFGVLLLEIIIGKKNNKYVPNSPCLNLVGDVWELWKEGRAMQAVDLTLDDSCPADEILKCI